MPNIERQLVLCPSQDSLRIDIEDGIADVIRHTASSGQSRVDEVDEGEEPDRIALDPSLL